MLTDLDQHMASIKHIIKELLSGSLRSKHRPSYLTNKLGYECTNWMVLHNSENPTTDYYIRTKASKCGADVHTVELSSSPEQETVPEKIIIVRYLNKDWANWLHLNRKKIKTIVFFMDDELLRPQAWTQLPVGYQKKLASNFKILQRWLPKLVDEYWVSTSTLASSNKRLHAKIVNPAPLLGDELIRCRNPDPSREHLLFYHATASHISEFTWLRPIIRTVIERNPIASFEVIGDHEINKIFRDIPRTRILHPMSWANYREFTSSVSGGLGLAPLLDNEFNQARACVKSYDIQRMNAWGLYSESPAYDSMRADERSIVAQNSQEEWIKKIEAWVNRQS